ncbi:MAG: nicotinate (nicotinamide) nucleotide adenylyltransferase [Acidobacteria bacterium]|nr:nicotinate (nicotinamide) nucleotide adenylyltransferase [Acidobacteriota bacterium]
MNTLRVGILGGTFDPVHIGHLHVAREVRKLFRLDQIWFLIARTPPHKSRSKISPEWHRCSMVALATQDDPRLRICHYELSSQSGYTIDTLRALRRQYRSRVLFYFIAGGDTLREFATWHCFESLLEEFHMIFVRRPGGRSRRLPADVDPRVAAFLRWYRAGDAPWDQNSFLIDVGAPNVSSTEIRRPANAVRMKKWVTPGVYQYIRKYRLYEKP